MNSTRIQTTKDYDLQHDISLNVLAMTREERQEHTDDTQCQLYYSSRKGSISPLLDVPPRPKNATDQRSKGIDQCRRTVPPILDHRRKKKRRRCYVIAIKTSKNRVTKINLSEFWVPKKREKFFDSWKQNLKDNKAIDSVSRSHTKK